MARIIEYLSDQGNECLVVVDNKKNDLYERGYYQSIPVITIPHKYFCDAILDILEWWRPDIALMWSIPARVVSRLCYGKGIPYMLFVRYWHLVNKPPYNDLLTDPIDKMVWPDNAWIHRHASIVVVNAKHTRQVIERFFGIDSAVSYVPVPRLPKLGEGCRIALINPRKHEGGQLVRYLAEANPGLLFTVYDNYKGRYPANVEVNNYVDIPYNQLLGDTRVLLFPVTDDGCGTGRVVFEAHYLGIPVISNRKSGVPEVVPGEHLLPANATYDAWNNRLHEINREYDYHRGLVERQIDNYSELEQLETIERVLEGVKC